MHALKGPLARLNAVLLAVTLAACSRTPDPRDAQPGPDLAEVQQGLGQAPTAYSKDVTVPKNTTVAVTLRGFDPEGDALTFSVTQAPANGALSGTAPNVTYAPALNFTGTDTFKFVANDGTSDSVEAQVTLTVAAINRPPVALGQSIRIIKNTSNNAITLGGTDPDGDPLTYQVLSSPTLGTLSGTAPNLLYTVGNTTGNTNFTFRVSDGAANSSITTVAIAVANNAVQGNGIPVGTNQSVTVAADSTVAFTLGGVDLEVPNVINFDSIFATTLGVTVGGANLARQYTPPAGVPSGASVSDHFTFTVRDANTPTNNISPAAAVDLTVVHANNLPVASAVAVNLLEDAAPTAVTLMGRDFETPDGSLVYALVTPPSYGVLSGTLPNLFYKPNANVNGVDSFTYQITDGSGGTSQVATVTLNVAPVDDAPVGDPQSLTFLEDSVDNSITLTATDVDTPVVSLTYAIATGPLHGTLGGSAPNVTYTPAPNYFGPDSFTFTANDGSLTSTPVVITLTVTNTNDAPTASAQTVFALEDVGLPMTLLGTDPDGDPLTFTVAAGPSFGTLSGTPPNVTYTGSLNFSGADSITVVANDGFLDSPPATITISIAAVDDPPVADSQNLTFVEDSVANAILLTGSDVDTLPAAFSFTVVSGPAHGSLGGTGAALTYTPAPNYAGLDGFTFVINDGTSDSAPAIVALSITNTNDLPVALSASVTASEETDHALSLAALDADGDPLTYTVIAAPANGTLSGTPPNLTYRGNLDFNGSDSLTFRANDGTGDSNDAVVSITVSPVDDSPVATGGSATFVEDSIDNSLTLAATDVDTAPGSLTFTVVSGPTHGSLGGSGANLTYTPAPDYAGPDGFTFEVSDATSTSAPTTFTIDVTGTNDLPVASNQSVNGTEDVDLSITLAASDVDGDPLTYFVVAGPANGTLSGTPPNLTYRGSLDYSGSDTITFRANDATGDSNDGVVSITLAAVDDPPIANPGSATFLEDSTANSITLSGTDIDTAQALTFTVVSGPTHGSLGGNGANLTYTPAPDYTGPDSLTFEVSDATSTSAPATFTLDVTPTNDLPVATDQSASGTEDTDLSITLAATDIDGDPLTYSVVAGPTNGTLTGTPPNLTYRGHLDLNGSDSFTFLANDGTGDSNEGVVSITLTSVDDPPVATPQNSTFAEDSSSNGITLSATDVDTETTSLTFTVVTPPGHGSLGGAAPNLTYTPDADYFGPDRFTFVANDGNSDSAPATVDLTISAVNDPPVATAQSTQSVVEDTPVDFALVVSDVDGDALTFVVTSPPTKGSIAVKTGSALPDVTFTPTKDQNGPDSFTYRVTDPMGAQSALVTVDLDIAPSPDPPVADDQTLWTAIGAPLSITLTGSDPDGDSFAFDAPTAPANGTLTGVPPDLTYTPNQGFVGSDVFTFTVTDATSLTSAAGKITVSVGNRPPVATSQSVSLNEDSPKAVALAGTDADGDPLTYSVASAPTHGTLTGTPPNLTYTPASNFNGVDGFTFTAYDGIVTSAPGTVTLTVLPVNDVPVADNKTASTPEGTPVAITLTGSDIEASTLTFVPANPAHGTLSGTAPNLTYTPAAGYAGADSFTYTVSDGQLTSAPATVTISVVWANLTITASNLTPLEGQAVTFSVVIADPGAAPTFAWNFGDGATAAGQSPAHTFADNGVYTVVVQATDSGGTRTAQLSMTVANAAPQIGAINGPTSGPEGSSLAFTSTVADLGGTSDPLTYSWNWGDGSPASTGPAASHTYADNGVFTLTLTVVDDDGGFATMNQNLTITNGAPNIAAIAPQTTTVGALLQVALTATDSSGDQGYLLWALVTGPGDITIAGVYSFTPAAADVGLRTVTVSVTDKDGATSTANFSVDVKAAGGPALDAGTPGATDAGTGTHEDDGHTHDEPAIGGGGCCRAGAGAGNGTTVFFGLLLLAVWRSRRPSAK